MLVPFYRCHRSPLFLLNELFQFDRKGKPMQVKAQRVSKKKDNVTWCLPSEGYATDNAIEVELGDYVEFDTVHGELPENDETWPKGAYMTDYVKVGDKILQRKTP